MKNSIKRKFVIIPTIAFITVICFSTITSGQEENIDIVCSNSVLADFTSNLITENVTIEYIMPSGVCPAFYDTTPSDVSSIINADVIISFGSPTMEPWLSDLLEYNEDCNIIECKNMGEWNLPANAKIYVEYIADQLADIYPELNTTIIENSETYLGEIDETAANLQEMIETQGYQDKKVIAMAWQKDFIEFLGLNVTFSYGPPQGLSVQDELDVISVATEDNVSAVIDNLQSGTEFGARVASESGASHVIFTNFPEAVPGTDTYLDMITYNTQQLIDGIENYEYKKGDIENLQNQIDELEFQRNAAIIFVAILAITSLAFYAMYKKK
jgi:ABC-type Zn uptake system ZnuABC Zn-binding protein ZnuA